jgi:hypothetical protein
MRLSPFVAALIACALAVSDAPVRADGWLLHRRPLQWLEPSPPVVAPGTVVPQPQAPPVEPKATDPMTPPPTTTAPTAEPSFSPLVSAALGDSGFAMSAPGYLDFAMPMNQLRLRYDAAYNMNRPDRAEFFYAKCGCFGIGSPGPVNPERSVDAQEASAYLEVAPTKRFSVFFDLPVRSINPDVNANETGIGDIRFGFKYAFLYTDTQIATFQLRGFAPTGDARRGLGTHHSTVEPALLYYNKLSERLSLYGEFAGWIPINGTDFAGNILIYGAGLGYSVYDTGSFRVQPLAEIIGWSVLDGKEFNPNVAGATVSAGGDTIVNGKLGVRAGGSRQDVYFGYGRALTGERWYQDIVRLEYRLKF